MGRHDRVQTAGMYHAMTHAVANSWLFIEDDDYLTRLALLSGEVDRGTIRLHQHCFMGNHEHFLLTVDENDILAKVMQRINRSYAGTFNRAHRRRGRLYRSRYESKPILSERQLLNTIRYIALNPEHHGFEHAETYRWSSYPALVGLVAAPMYIDEQPLLDAFGGGKDARRRLKEFVDGGRLPTRRLGKPPAPVPGPGPGTGERRVPLDAVLEPLGLGERLELLERVVLDLADAFARDPERLADLLERARL
jgi:putative transposase